MKKIIMTAAMCLALSGTATADPGCGQCAAVEETAVVVVEDCGAECGTPECPGTCDAVAVADNTPMTPEGPEGKIANRMTQAEKARNAAVNDSWGGAITLIAMCIVISVLAVLSILFLCFGKISEALIAGKKKKTAKVVNRSGDVVDHEPVDSAEAIAAIAMALSEHFGGAHDMEDTILTMRHLKRAYSPWNSKIYNLRQMPELHKQNPGRSAF